jgi:YesN/AraC family two-component response regulator
MNDHHVVMFMTKPVNQKTLLNALHKVLKTVNPHPEE